MTIATLIKKKHLIGMAYGFRGLVYCHQGREHGGVQADAVLEKELLQVDMQPTGSRLSVTLSKA